MVRKGGTGRGIPPQDMYTVELVRVVDYGPAKMGFEGKDPEDQFTLEFAILDYIDPDTDEPMLIRGWYTNKWEHIDGYQPPKLHKLVKAMNGGQVFETPDEFDGWDMLEEHFIGKTFRVMVGCNDKGYARFQGDPVPTRAKRTPPPARGRVVDNVDQDTGEITGGNGAVDDDI
jgi:hypothetical protein